MSERPSWDEHFLLIAYAVAGRADCTRRQVGAVLVRENRIVSTGYNGAPAGQPGCLSDGACPRGRMSQQEVAPSSSYDTGPGTCIAIHAELNALLYAGQAAANGATLYVTDEPCPGCAKVIQAAGVQRVVCRGSSG